LCATGRGKKFDVFLFFVCYAFQSKVCKCRIDVKPSESETFLISSDEERLVVVHLHLPSSLHIISPHGIAMLKDLYFTAVVFSFFRSSFSSTPNL